MNDDTTNNLMQLAYLKVDAHLSEDMHTIMEFVAQLSQVNTEGVAPLFHPFDLAQRLRSDKVTEENVQKALAKIAPRFEDGLYLVPKVIESGQ